MKQTPSATGMPGLETSCVQLGFNHSGRRAKELPPRNEHGMGSHRSQFGPHRSEGGS
jgi:hypothetical protein